MRGYKKHSQQTLTKINCHSVKESFQAMLILKAFQAVLIFVTYDDGCTKAEPGVVPGVKMRIAKEKTLRQ